MTFGTIYAAVEDQFGDATTAMETRIKRYINDSQNDIVGREDWDFARGSSFFQCTAPYTTGTADVVNGATTVAGTDTVWTAAMVGRKIRFGTDIEYYTIATRSGNTAITLDQTYVGSLTTGNTYTIFQDVYSLAANVEKVTDMRNPTYSTRLQHWTRQQFDIANPNPQGTGSPFSWAEAGRNTTTGYLQVQLANIPDAAYVIYYWFRKQATDLSATGDISIIPLQYHRLLYLGACAQAYDYDQSPSAASYWAQYENGISDMRKYYLSGSEDTVTIIGSGPDGGSRQAQLNPTHFPAV